MAPIFQPLGIAGCGYGFEGSGGGAPGTRTLRAEVVVVGFALRCCATRR